MTENAALKSGVLHVIATPIGNLADLSSRMRDTMQQVDVLYAEDTRHTGKLCREMGINPQLRSLHDHNEADRVQEVLGRLQSGESVGLVSDAGTPLISDPGYRIVAACHEASVRVSPVPGPSAVIAALSVCGLPTDRFSFYGFLPARSAARRELLSEVAAVVSTSVFFESKHRLLESLKDMGEVLGDDRKICIARELSKTFETVLQGEVGSLLEQVRENHNWQKGEFVLVVSGAQAVKSEFSEQTQSLLLAIAKEAAPKKAVAIVAAHTGLDKKMLYDWLVAQKKSQ
jgi:16S rRNA (cytidine1402-2'-O)-methyltransferase